MVKRLVLRRVEEKRERGVTAWLCMWSDGRLLTGCEHGLTEGLCPSPRIVNVLDRETSLETGLHRSSRYPAGLSRGVSAACRTQALHELTGADKSGARMPDARTGHWTGHSTGYRTRGHRARGRWTCTGRRTLDTCRTPDTGRPDAGHVDADRATKARWDGDPCCCGRHTALGNHDGSTVRYLPARDCRLYCHAAAGSRRRRPSGASAHCCRVLDLDGTSGGQWDEGKVRGAGSGW